MRVEKTNNREIIKRTTTIASCISCAIAGSIKQVRTHIINLECLMVGETSCPDMMSSEKEERLGQWI